MKILIYNEVENYLSTKFDKKLFHFDLLYIYRMRKL